MKKILKAFAEGLLAAFIGGLSIAFIVAVMCFIAWEMPDTLIKESWIFRVLLFPAVIIAAGVAYSLTDKD